MIYDKMQDKTLYCCIFIEKYLTSRGFSIYPNDHTWMSATKALFASNYAIAKWFGDSNTIPGYVKRKYYDYVEILRKAEDALNFGTPTNR